LNLAEILPWLAELSNRKSPPATESLKAAPPPAVVHPLTVLEVASGEEMITLLADGIDYVEEIDDMCSTGQGTDGVVRLADRLFPAYSLARLRGLSTSLNERQAVIVRTAQGAWALTVERVLGLKQIDHFQSIPSGGKTSSGAPSQPPGIWYLTETLQMRQLFDPNVLIGQSGEQKQDMQMPAGEPPFSILSEQLGSEGLRVQCGECTFILPVVLTQRVMDNLSPAMKCQPTPGQQRDYRVPFLDGTLLTSGRLRHQPANINIRLALSARRSVVLAVDRIALQATLPAERWFPLPPLPSPASLFFDAAAYDVEQEQWMLRVRSDSSKVQWSHLIRQSAWAEKVSLALLGWLDSTLLDEKED
jgi:chemotaxis signal transduction protein